MLSSHPWAALEYWFFKVNLGSTALLVDWIDRRRANEKWLRVSIHSPYGREVLFEKRGVLMSDDNFLRLEHTRGQLGETAWDLAIDFKGEWIAPDIFPAVLLRMTDLAAVSAPRATFTGWIRHHNEQLTLQNTPGMVAHYWGRQLASEWWWVSANQFDQPGYAVEFTVIRTSLWGTPLQMPFAYLYLSRPTKREFVLAPLNLARVTGSPDAFEIKIQRVGAETISLIGTGRDYGNLGDGIVNTLVGDLEIREGGTLLARAKGTAGLERRDPNKLMARVSSFDHA